MVSRYQRPISEPLLDRNVSPPCGIDVYVEVPLVDSEELSSDPWRDFTLQGLRWLGAPSRAMRSRVEAGRERQWARLAGTWLATNANIGPAEIRQRSALGQSCLTYCGTEGIRG
jgi:predicted ATPase with chaperone activity